MKRDLIRRLVSSAVKHRLTLVKVEEQDFELEFEMRHAAKAAPVKSEPKVHASIAKAVSEVYIRSNLVGYFRATSKALATGASISEDTVIGTVEALGLNNELPARVKGKVVEVLVADGQPVEYGQAIAKVEA